MTEKDYVLHISCHKCHFLDLVFKSKADEWRCPVCEACMKGKGEGKFDFKTPLRWKLEFSGDFYEDWTELKELVSIRDIMKSNHDADEMLRSRYKYNEISDDEANFIEKVRETLNVEIL